MAYCIMGDKVSGCCSPCSVPKAPDDDKVQTRCYSEWSAILRNEEDKGKLLLVEFRRMLFSCLSIYGDYNFTAYSLARKTWSLLTFKLILFPVWQVWRNSEPSATFASNQYLAFWTKRRCSDYMMRIYRRTAIQLQLLLGLHLGQHKYQQCAQK